mgnify:CR=1 FL=1
MAKKNVNQEEVVNEVAVVETEVINETEELNETKELPVTEEEVDEVEVLKKKLLELEGKLNVDKGENKREKNREKKEALVARIKSMAVEERMTRQQIVDKLKTEPGMEWIGYYYVQQILRGTGLDIVRANAKKENKTLEDLLAEKKRIEELIAAKM